MSAAAALRARVPVAPLPEHRPRAHRGDARLLVVDPDAGSVVCEPFAALARRLAPGDLLVVNDAATLPAALFGRAEGRDVELRVRRALDHGRFEACLFGAGDHRTKTENRPRPKVRVGTEIAFGRERLLAVVLEVLPHGAIVRFDARGKDLVLALHAVGVPVQYAHVPERLATWDVQTAYAGSPWASEMPSAGRPLTTETLLACLSHGVAIAALTHAAGLSSIGDLAADAEAPPAERYAIPARTADLVDATKARGGRVVAVGTTVVRALEGNHTTHGRVVAGEGVTDLVLGPHSSLAVVDGLVSGLHEPGTSHLALVSAFADSAVLEDAWHLAGALGLGSHELGDGMLVLPRADRKSRWSIASPSRFRFGARPFP